MTMTMTTNIDNNWNRAVNLAASHFLSRVPEGATAEDIFAALAEDELPEGYLIWERFRDDPDDKDELIDLIRNLAEDFVSFAGMKNPS
jgi:hypothetical protein